MAEHRARTTLLLLLLLGVLPFQVGAVRLPAVDRMSEVALTAARDALTTTGCRPPFRLDPVTGCVRDIGDGMLEYVGPDGSTGTTHGAHGALHDPDHEHAEGHGQEAEAEPAQEDPVHEHEGEHDQDAVGGAEAADAAEAETETAPTETAPAETAPAEDRGGDLAVDVDGGASRALPTTRRPVACTGPAGARTVVLYGHRAGANRLSELRGKIRTTVERSNQAVALSARASGGPAADLRVRCTSSGQVAVTAVQLTSNRFADVRAALAAAGYARPGEKYLVFADLPSPQANVAGTADLYLDDRRSVDNHNNGRFPMYAAVYESRNFSGSVALHELAHTMGAVQTSAPKADGAGHCTDQLDVLCYPSNSSRCGTLVFDCGNDTYFSTNTRPGEWLHARWNLGWEGNRFIRLAVKPAAAPPPTPWQRGVDGTFATGQNAGLAALNPSTGGLWVAETNGRSLQRREWTRLTTTKGWAVHLSGDVNGSGLDDVISYHPGNGSWWVQRSTGRSFVQERWGTYAARTGWRQHLAGDFTGNGRTDIVSFHGNGSWWVGRNRGSNFAVEKWGRYRTTTGWKSHHVADVDGDGRDDILSYHRGTGRWFLQRSLGNTFAAAVPWQTYGTKSGWGTHLTGDVNGDGRADLLSFHSGTGRWWLTLAPSAPSLADRLAGRTKVPAAPSLFARYRTVTGWQFHGLADVTGDRRAELVSFHGASGALWVHKANGQASSGSSGSSWGRYRTTSGWGTHRLLDLTGDGRSDLVSYHTGSDRFWVSPSTGSSFAASERW